MLLLMATPTARAYETGCVLMPASPGLFETYAAGARVKPPPGCLLLVGKMDSPSFSIDEINQLTAILPSGKIVPLHIDERRVLREFGKIISMEFYLAASETEFSESNSLVILRWGSNIAADNVLVRDFSLEPAQIGQCRVLGQPTQGASSEEEGNAASASIQVIADKRASYIPLWHLLPMALIFVLLSVAGFQKKHPSSGQ